MQIGSGANTYDWVDNWARVPDTDKARSSWSHHGIVVTQAGDIMTFDQGNCAVVTFGKDGTYKGSWDAEVTNAHCMFLVKEGDTEYLWISDNGAKRIKETNYEGDMSARGGQVVKKTLDGKTVLSLQRPDLPAYREGKYSPTWVAVNEERYGGNGDIWVADGYGQSYTHRYDKAGNYISSINGEEGQGGAWDNCHGIYVDRRKGEPELYVALRRNQHVQVYDLEGKYKRVFGGDHLTTPGGFVVQGDHLIVIELRARLTVFDADDKFVCHLGDNEVVCDNEGWPNSFSASGERTVPTFLEAGKFNSPHGMAVDSEGNLYVAEFLIGGRITKLEKK